MSKTTKIIAALGVVAGLGVAALPAFTFAADPVSGDVDLYVKVNPAIAMTITGNNDNASAEGHIDQGSSHDGVTHGAVARAVPDGVFGITANTNTSSSALTMLPNTFDTMTSVVTVYTNNTTGYNLSVATATGASDSDMHGVTATNTITADATGFVNVASGATETTSGGLGKWAYKTNTSEHNPSADPADGILAADTYTAMSSTAQTLRRTSGPTTSGDPTTVTYGVSTDDDQAVDTYKTKITYTAACN